MLEILNLGKVFSFMTKIISLKKAGIVSLAVIALAIVFALTTVVANAQTGTGGATLSAEKRAHIEQKHQERLAEQQKRMDERKSEIEARTAEAEAKREENKEKFTEKRLEQCQKREARINEKMQKIAERKAAQVEVFNKIAERTIAFYEENALVLSNYDELSADVSAKKGVVEAEIANLKSTVVDFECDSEDPLKVSEAFKSAREAVVTAMKDYKTSVKNLIVGVKSVAPSDDSQEGGAQ